ncbi:hypothetical protein BDR07DRAFT_1490342 [Suillus spraguei]|nr:hypothetical protein BDR07DRAFT_1490342 [Suillus spraguei]
MEKFLWKFTDVGNDGSPHAKNIAGGKWTQAADETVAVLHGGSWLSCNLQTWSKAYIKYCAKLPMHRYGNHHSRIDDKVLATDIKLHLQCVGKYVSAQEIVNYLSNPEVQSHHGLSKTISLVTAQRWMLKLGYHWKEEEKGQYVDGHEREDVVTYHQKEDDVMVEEDLDELPRHRRVVVWFHDESTFYAHDRHDVRWVHSTEAAVPKPKGEGASLMVAHFVSADYGWLQSKDGAETAHILFKAGKGWDGFFTMDNIIAHAKLAMDILDKYFPHDDHILIFDNATTHVKRADDTPAARNMPKNPSKTWGPMVTTKDMHGNVMHDANGKPLKSKMQLADTHLIDGTLQSFYFMEGHEKAWLRFSMNEDLMKKQASNRNVLASNVPLARCRIAAPIVSFIISPTLSMSSHTLKLFVRNMCWGFAKQVYRQFKLSSKEDDLEHNVIAACDSIPLQTMCKFAIRSRRFIDAYQKGLNGMQAAWAVKKYCGHRILPESIMQNFDNTTPTV